MLASLPMYDRPELRLAHRNYWHLIRHNLKERAISAETELVATGIGDAFWTDPNLILSQTCGLPYRARLRGKMNIIGTPDFGVEGCPSGFYRSAVIARQHDSRITINDFAGSALAINAYDSQSGFAAIANEVADFDTLLPKHVVTGSHKASARAVIDGTADIAAIDSVSWGLMKRYDGFAEHLKVVEWTKPTPGLPYVCARNQPAKLIFECISQAINDLANDDRATLGISGIVMIAESEYLSVPTPDIAKQVKD